MPPKRRPPKRVSGQTESERAVDLAYRALGRRERTVAELKTYLEDKRVEPSAIEFAVEELSESGFLDDAVYARKFAEDKRTLARWGSERIARDLERRGVDPEVVAAALASYGHEDELRSALDLLAERLPDPPQSDRDRDRAWRLLVRRGYGGDLAYDAVRLHRRGAAA